MIETVAGEAASPYAALVESVGLTSRALVGVSLALFLACSAGSSGKGPPGSTDGSADEAAGGSGGGPTFDAGGGSGPAGSGAPDAARGDVKPEAPLQDAPADEIARGDASSSDALDAKSLPTGPTGSFVFGNGGACAHELTNPSCWSGYGVSALHPVGAFQGGAFDGKYLYLVSSNDATSNPVTRYDTSANFATADSWSTFNLSTVNPTTPAFAGAAFDGQFVYFVPCDPGFGSVLSRYDTQAPFDTATSWSNFDMATINGLAPQTDGQCDVGAVFAAPYVYFVPNSIYEYWRGTVERYDTRAPFTAASSWRTFDTLSLAPLAAGFRGATFDGRYIYFVPWGDLSVGFVLAVQGPPLITRFDTMGTFTDPKSWTTFDTSKAGVTNAFVGATFDGRFVYFPPGDRRGHLTRYDTRGSFVDPASWSNFDMNTLGLDASTEYESARFDGRYIYVIPSGSALIRYDTMGPFADGASWSRLDLTTLEPRASGYRGGVFDGHYLYLVPAQNNLVLRFDAAVPGPVPAHAGASFF